MLKIKRYVNNVPYSKKELYKNEISDEAVYKVLKKVRSRAAEKSGEADKVAK